MARTTLQPGKLTKGEATRRALLEAAERHFAEDGFEIARLEAIAEEAGIRQAGVFYYFASKRELFGAVSDDIHAALMGVTEARLHGLTDPWEQLTALTDTWLDFMVARPSAARLILRACAGLSQACAYPAGHSGDAVAVLRAILERGMAEGRFRAVNPMHLVNLLSGSILHYVCNPGLTGQPPAYAADDPREIAAFKALLRQTARAALEVA
ncbi:MAG: TetR/AcrR family transcriptional regulator [Sphingomonadales bacterium]|nr:TetR/AcrR family transcriptional regulator [Sphingomonadales bacterium]